MNKFFKQFLVEDWVVTILAIPLLIIAALAAHFPSVEIQTASGIKVEPYQLKVLSDLTASNTWINFGIFFVIALIVLYLGNRMLSRPLRGLFVSFVVVFALSVLAQWIAKIKIVNEFGFEAVFFSVIIGLIVRNCFHIPDWLKPAIQGEFFIKVGVVCLGATILFRDVMRSGSVGLVQAILVVTIVWLFAFFLSRMLKVDERTAMTLSSGCSICGVSACITAARVAGTDDKKLSYIVSLVLIIVVPMIYLMPYLGKLIVPLLTDDLAVQSQIMGAWIGGTIDTTSGVTASSGLFQDNDAVQNTAIIVKATQNVLIGVVAFFIALYLSTKSADGSRQRPTFGIVWEKFPKFILGFVAASLVFSLCQSFDVFVPYKENLTTGAIKLYQTDLAKSFSTFFFSLAFVCIGLDTRLKDIISKDNRNVLYAFLGAQTFNIIVTLLCAYLLFGIINPLLG